MSDYLIHLAYNTSTSLRMGKSDHMCKGLENVLKLHMFFKQSLIIVFNIMVMSVKSVGCEVFIGLKSLGEARYHFDMPFSFLQCKMWTLQ